MRQNKEIKFFIEITPIAITSKMVKIKRKFITECIVMVKEHNQK